MSILKRYLLLTTATTLERFGDFLDLWCIQFDMEIHISYWYLKTSHITENMLGVLSPREELKNTAEIVCLHLRYGTSAWRP